MKFYASTSSNTVLWTGTKEQVIGLLQSYYCSHVSNGSLPSEPSESRPLEKHHTFAYLTHLRWSFCVVVNEHLQRIVLDERSQLCNCKNVACSFEVKRSFEVIWVCTFCHCVDLSSFYFCSVRNTESNKQCIFDFIYHFNFIIIK